MYLYNQISLKRQREVERERDGGERRRVCMQKGTGWGAQNACTTLEDKTSSATYISSMGVYVSCTSPPKTTFLCNFFGVL